MSDSILIVLRDEDCIILKKTGKRSNPNIHCSTISQDKKRSGFRVASRRKSPVPTSIKALYTNYEVVVTNLNEHNVEPDSPLYGKVDWERQIVFLEENQAEDLMKETLWHEVKHIAWSLSSLNKSLYLGGSVDEEEVVARLTTMEMTIFKDNPRLVDYLLG